MTWSSRAVRIACLCLLALTLTRCATLKAVNARRDALDTMQRDIQTCIGAGGYPHLGADGIVCAF